MYRIISHDLYLCYMCFDIFDFEFNSIILLQEANLSNIF